MSGKLDVGTLDLLAPTATDDFNFTGGILVADTVLGDLYQDGGTLSPGDSPGFTDITGDFIMSSGDILFEIDGLLRGIEFDAIDVAGLAMLDGTMDVDLLGYAPMEGDSFLLVDAGSYSGSATFDFSDAGLGVGLAWDTSSFLTDGTISISAVPEPSSAMLILGLCVVAAIRRRRRT